MHTANLNFKRQSRFNSATELHIKTPAAMTRKELRFMAVLIQMVLSLAWCMNASGQDSQASKIDYRRSTGYFLAAQYENPDSLRQALQLAQTDSARYLINSILGGYYTEVNADSALYFREVALSIARKNGKKLDEAGSQNNKGYSLMQLGRFPESYQCFQEALKLAGNPNYEADTWWPGDKESEKRLTRLYFLANIHNDFSHLLRATGKIEQSIFHLMTTREIATEIQDKSLLGIVDKNLGKSYILINKLDSALLLEETAIQKLQHSDGKKYISDAYNIIGQVNVKQHNIDLAAENFRKGIQSAIEQKNLTYLTANYASLTQLFLEQNKNKDSSLLYAKKNLALLQAMGSKDLGNAYLQLFKSFEINGMSDSANKYQGLALAFKDSTYQARIKALSAFQNMSFEDLLRLKELEREKVITQNNIRSYALLAGLIVFSIVAGILYRNNQQKQTANKILESTLTNLKSTQAQLVQSEKMASLGELTAGIAHEIQNPLNFVNNFSDLNKELIEELQEELKKGDVREASSIAENLKENEDKINLHGRRADGIVKSMLQHSRASSGQKEPTDVNKLVDEYVRLAYHGYRARKKDFNVTLDIQLDPEIGKVPMVAQDIGRVILNLLNNAFQAVEEKAKTAGADYQPTVSIQTQYGVTLPQDQLNPKSDIRNPKSIAIAIADNGPGIPESIKDKIFQPFFTTKPTGQGTGLGLSLSYDIMKAHGGLIELFDGKPAGSIFQLQLPATGSLQA
jgi:signal transduction histidine kinase